MGSTKPTYVDVPAGSAVFKEGEVGGELYIIESGQVELVPRTGASLTMLGAGDFLGETALLDKQPHPTTAVAKTNARLLRIDTSMLAEVVGQNGAIGVNLLRQLAARTLRTEQRLREIGIELAALKTARDPSAPARTADAPTPVRNTKSESLQVTLPPPASIALHVTGAGQTITLDTARSDFLIGRPDPLTGAVPDIDLGSFDGNRTLSRRHARLLREGGQYFVREDSATTNGTHVNGARLQTGVSVPIKPGDKLYFGSIEVEVVAA